MIPRILFPFKSRYLHCGKPLRSGINSNSLNASEIYCNAENPWNEIFEIQFLSATNLFNFVCLARESDKVVI